MDREAGANPQRRILGPPTSFAVALALTMAIAAIVVPSIGALSSFIVDELAITRTQLGWLVAAVSMSSAILAPASGRLADKYGGRRMILLLLAAGSAVFLGLAAAPTFYAFVAVAVVAGAMNSIGNPATNRLIASEMPIGSRGLVMGIKQSGIPAGIFLAGMLFPIAAQAMGWRSALASASILPFAVSLVARRKLPSRSQSLDRTHSRKSADSSGDQRYGLTMRALVLYSFLMGVGDVSIIAFGPLYLQESLDWSVALAGRAIATAGALGIAARIFWSRWAESRDRLLPTLLIMAVSSSCATLAFWLSAPLTDGLIWIGVVLFGSVSLAWNAIVYLMAINSYGNDKPGRASGFVMFGFMTGSTLGPVAFGYSVDLTGSYSAGWAVALTSFALAGAHILRVLPHRNVAS